jgi:hypothetical protein
MWQMSAQTGFVRSFRFDYTPFLRDFDPARKVILCSIIPGKRQCLGAHVEVAVVKLFSPCSSPQATMTVS